MTHWGLLRKKNKKNKASERDKLPELHEILGSMLLILVTNPQMSAQKQVFQGK